VVLSIGLLTILKNTLETWRFDMAVHVLGRVLANEFRSGVGFDIEFTNSRPVWTYDASNGELNVMCFEGVVILVPFFTLLFGKVYSVEDL